MSEPTNNAKKTEKGQSFVELMLVLIFLVMFILGIVEFGTLLNQYLNLVDGAREAARIVSDYDPLDPIAYPDPSAHGFEEDAIKIAEDVMKPLVLDAALGDDIVVSYFIVGKDSAGDAAHAAFARYPTGEAGGWNHLDNKDSKFSDADIQARVDGDTLSRGIFLIEIYYNYPQRLKVPVFSSIVPDPIPVYTYVFMPLPRFQP